MAAFCPNEERIRDNFGAVKHVFSREKQAVTGATAQKKATLGGPNRFDLRQELLSLYPNRHRSILKPPGCQNWTTVSKHGYLSDETILKAVSGTENRIWGCRWGEQTIFAVLDIDAKSQYHNELGLARLIHVLESCGIQLGSLYQSSDSGGWHAYIFFSDWVKSEDLQDYLNQLLKAEGFEIKQGQLEIFPSNNGLRLPLQRGFAWLDASAQILIRRDELKADEAIYKFLQDSKNKQHNWEIVRTRIISRLKQIASEQERKQTKEYLEEEPEEDGFSTFFSEAGKLLDVYNAGRNYWQNGLTEPSQRHHAILAVGHYLWYGDESNQVRALPGARNSQRRAKVILSWLQENHNGYSNSVLKNDWKEIEADILRACNWAPQEAANAVRAHYPLTDRAIDRLIDRSKQTGRVWQVTDFEKGNIGREEEARTKIRSGLVQLIESGRRITVRGLERVTGCKRETIRRHADIWGVFRLSNGPGDLSCGGAVPQAATDCSQESLFNSEKSENEIACSESKAVEESVIDLDALKLNLKGLTEEEKRAAGWTWYQQLYLTDPEKPIGILDLHDGEKALFHDRTFDHAFYRSSNYQLYPKKKDLIDFVRLERVRWIAPLICGQVSQSSCFEVVALSGRPGITNRVYLAHGQSYLVFLEPRAATDVQWKFSSAFPSTPGYIQSKVTSGSLIWTNRSPPRR